MGAGSRFGGSRFGDGAALPGGPRCGRGAAAKAQQRPRQGTFRHRWLLAGADG